MALFDVDLIGPIETYIDAKQVALQLWFERTFPILSWLWEQGLTPWLFLVIGIGLGMASAKFGWRGALVFVGSLVGAAVAGRLVL